MGKAPMSVNVRVREKRRKLVRDVKGEYVVCGQR